MEIITMESAAYKELTAKIDLIAGYVRENEQSKKKDAAEVWMSSRELKGLLGISTRTLQRLRDNKRISYAIFGGACRYPVSEVERLVKESIYNCDARTVEEFKRNYLLRTGGKKDEHAGLGYLRGVDAPNHGTLRPERTAYRLSYGQGAQGGEIPRRGTAA